jgi:hypothetical protein
MLDDQNLDRSFSGFQFQSQLLLYCGENRSRGRFGSKSTVGAGLTALWLIRRPLQLDIVFTRQPCPILDNPTQLLQTTRAPSTKSEYPDL